MYAVQGEEFQLIVSIVALLLLDRRYPASMRPCKASLVQNGFAAAAHRPRPARLAPVRAQKSESDDITRDEFMEELSTMKYRFQKPTKAQRLALEIGWKLSGAKRAQVRERCMQISDM